MMSDKRFGENVTRRAVGITETSLRDGHQSLMATRMRTDDMLPVVDMMDEVGFHSLEVWGGATFDTCMRFLDEDPWERLRTLRRHFKKSKLQMLLRGQNVVGYRHYADDTVREFVKRAVGNGLDIIRIFDALNDLRNMEIAADQVKKEGAHLQMAISYTISPVHTLEAFLQMALDMVSMGADSICIKDMAGLLGPMDAYNLVKNIKEKANVPVQMHTHYTSGLASMAYMAAVMAGADVVDCAISPFAMGTSQPATETFVAALRDTPYDTGLSLEKLIPIAEYLKKVREKYSHLFMGMQGVDVNVLAYQIPGGMYSNFVSQLKEQNALDKLDIVLKEVERVRREMGYPPPKSRSTVQALGADLRQAARDLPVTARTAVKAAKLVAAQRKELARSRALQPSPEPGIDLDSTVVVPSVAIFVDAKEWDARAEALGGNSYSLVAGFAAKMAEHLGRRRSSDGAVTLVIAINLRESLDDDRALAMAFANATVDPTQVTTDLTEARAVVRTARESAKSQPDPTLELLPLMPWLPKPAVKGVAELLFAYSEDLPVSCSNLGDLPPQLAQLDGTDAEYVLIRALDQHVTMREIQRSHGQLVVVSGRINGKVVISVEAYEIGAENSKPRLRALAAQTLAEFELNGSIE